MLTTKERDTNNNSLTQTNWDPKVPFQLLIILVEFILKGTETRIFKVFPDLIKIPSNKSVLFEVEFNPDQNYNVFQETLTAQVDYTNQNDRSDNFTIPETTFLKVQGATYLNPETNCG